MGLVVLSYTTFGASSVKTALLPLDADTVGVAGFEGMTIDEFLALTPNRIKEKTGKKLSLKETLVLKSSQKKIKKALSGKPESDKSQLVALILVLVVGYLGIHRFYLGYTGIGIIQLLTFGGCGIWALIDLIRIVLGDLEPKHGEYSETL